MISILVGIIIGIVMGLTGAGGALVAIPLFMQFLSMNLKEASVLSLVVVVIASGLNAFSQRKWIDYKAAFVIIIFSGVGSFSTARYKTILSEWVIIVLLILVSLYALYAVWSKEKPKVQNQPNKSFPWLLSILVGLVLGVLTTFTGLGGGVLMLPIFIKLYGYDPQKAVATSLISVGISALISLIIQVQAGFQINFDLNLALILIGILVSVFMLKLILARISILRIDQLRKIIFTLVVIVAIMKII